jgi:cytochrome c oxidase subunit II
MGELPLFPQQASTVAGRVDALYFFMIGLSAFFTILIAVLLVYFAVRYRRRSEDEIPPQTTGSIRMEISWMVILFLLAMPTFFWSAWLFLDMSNPPAESMEINVMGKMWMWKFHHPDGQEEINELHVPVNRPVKLVMTSQDVLHSFFVPDFRIKQDVLPGRYTTVWFEATQTGVYHLFCTEYCGTNHSRMIGSVIVQEPHEYQAWLAGTLTQGSPAEQGERLYAQLGCASCHRLDGRGPGPSLVGLFGTERLLDTGETVFADEAYIRESILEPNAKIAAGFQPIMPTYQGQVTEEQLLQLIAYIRSLAVQPVEGVAPQPQPMGTPSGGATPVAP